jgi:3-oxoadipate enol-lactonase
LRALPVPALVMTGCEDRTSPPELARQTADLIADVRTHWVPAAGHLASLENPVDLDRTLVAWLANHWSSGHSAR